MDRFNSIPEQAERPLVTLGLTTYNCIDTIQRSITGIISQTYRPVEIIIVDDASEDGTQRRIEEILSASNMQVKLIKREVNGGPAAARNDIIRCATGEYIAFFDDDDLSRKARVTTQLALLRGFEQKMGYAKLICHSSFTRTYNSGYLKRFKAIGSIGDPLPGILVIEYLLYNQRSKGHFYGAGVPTSTMMVRRDYLIQLGMFDEKFRRLEDAELAIRAAMDGAHFVGCEQELVEQHHTSGSDKTYEINMKYEIALVKKNEQFLKKRRVYLYSLTLPKLRYYHLTKRYIPFLLLLTILFIAYPLRSIIHLPRSYVKRFLHERKLAKNP